MKTPTISTSLKYLKSSSIQVFLMNCSTCDLLPLLKYDEDIRYRLYAEMSHRSVMMIEEDMGAMGNDEITTAYVELERTLLSCLEKTKEDLMELQKSPTNKIKMTQKVKDCRNDYQRWKQKINEDRQQKLSWIQEGFANLAKGDFPVVQFHTWSLDPKINQCVNEKHLNQIHVMSLVWKFLLLSQIYHKDGSIGLMPVIAKEQNSETREALQLALENIGNEKTVFSSLEEKHQEIKQQLINQFVLLRQLISRLLNGQQNNHPDMEGVSPQNHQHVNLGDFSTQSLTQKMEFFRQIAKKEGFIAMEQHLEDESCQTIRDAVEMIIDGFEEADIQAYIQKDEQETMASINKKLNIIRDMAFHISGGASWHRVERFLICYLDPTERHIIRAGVE